MREAWLDEMNKPKKRKANPETVLTKEVRNVLHLLKIPNFKHFGGPMSERGVSDIIGTIPGSGRALFLELKAPSKMPRPDQIAFIVHMKAAGALAFWADSVAAVVERLAEAGYEPAKRFEVTLPNTENKGAKS